MPHAKFKYKKILMNSTYVIYPAKKNSSDIKVFCRWIVNDSHISLSKLNENIARMCVDVHKQVTQQSVLYYEGMKRRYYTTPSSYLDLRLYSNFYHLIKFSLQKLKENIARMCVDVHKEVTEQSVLYYEEMRRRYYTTPSSYLDLIRLYSNMLKDRKQHFMDNK